MRRIRSISLGTGVMLLVAVPFAALHWSTGLIYLSGAVVVTMGIATVNVLMLRHHRNVTLTGHVGTGALFALLVLSNSTSGGFYDPNFAWFYVIPVLAAVLVDLRAGWIWGTLIAAAAVVFWLLPRYGIDVPDFVPPEQHALYSLVNRLFVPITLTILASSFVFVQRSTEMALAVEVRERKRAELEAQRSLEERKRAEAKLVQSEKMASLGQLVAGVAHELNNPVNFISAALPILRRDLERLAALVPEAEAVSRDRAKARLDELLSTMDEGARRTVGLVRDLRVFSRLDEAEVKVADLHEALEATLSLLRYQLGEGSIEVVRRYGEIPEIECYVSELNQVFMNLLVNAIQAIDGPGQITLLTQRLENPKRVRILIRDTGSGVPREIRQRIFDPFFTTKPVGEGTGLGLAISHRIVERHGGSLEVGDGPGGGAELRLELPVLLPTTTAARELSERFEDSGEVA